MDSSYLDFNATVPLHIEALRVMEEVVHLPLNPSSTHAYGRKGRALIESARSAIAQKVGAEGNQVIFTASGTESNHLALNGVKVAHYFVASTEHPSVLHQDVPKTFIPVDQNGIVDLAILEEMLHNYEGSFLVSVMLANNETGVLQPIRDIAALVHRYGGIMHSDVSQAVGKIPVDMAALHVDMMSFSSHKLGGPKGAAVLIAKADVQLTSVFKGGGQEQGIRPGTENVAAIVGFKEAVMQITDTTTKVAVMRDSMEAQLKAIVPDLVIFGKLVARLPNTSYIAMPNVASDTQLMHFDQYKIMVSKGSACSAGVVKSSHVLASMGVAPEIASTALRVSIGAVTTMQEIARFIEIWQMLYERVNCTQLTSKVA